MGGRGAALRAGPPLRGSGREALDLGLSCDLGRSQGLVSPLQARCANRLCSLRCLGRRPLHRISILRPRPVLPYAAHHASDARLTYYPPNVLPPPPYLYPKPQRMAKHVVVKKSRITVDVGLDGQNMPVEMKWAASDNPAGQQLQPAKAMLLALFDEKTKETLKIDLWTREMQVLEMDRMFYQTLRGLADTYFRATNNKELASQMQQFVFYFGQATGAIPKEE